MNKKTNDAAIANEQMHRAKEGITARLGLLWRNGKVIHLPEADSVAIACGFTCAEAMVRSFERPTAADRVNKRKRAKRRYK